MASFFLSPFTQSSSKTPQGHWAELNLKVLDYVSSLKSLQNAAVKCSDGVMTWQFYYWSISISNMIKLTWPVLPKDVWERNFFLKIRAFNCNWWCMSALVPGGLTAAFPEEMGIPCVTLMASVPRNLLLYGIVSKSDTHLFQLDVGSMCAKARSCWRQVKLSGLTIEYFTQNSPNNIYFK